MDEQPLRGGVANAGQVVRVGNQVLRPAPANAGPIHRLLSWLPTAGFEGAPEPIGIDPDGRQRLGFIEGDVALRPYPSWAQVDEALASIGALLRRFHDATRAFDPAGMAWSDEVSDPATDTGNNDLVLCHNDVALDNVVFRDGRAVALIDFDFAAPGRALWDVAQFARMCIPIDDDATAARLGWEPSDKPARLRAIADAYGLDRSQRAALPAVMAQSIDRGEAFVRRRIEAGEASFVRVLDEQGGAARFDRRRRFWTEHEPAFIQALG
jgi:aminoglycoside phosphotransferase (APT) family kinase protein